MKVKNTITLSYTYTVDVDSTFLPLSNDDEEMEEFAEYITGEDPVYDSMIKALRNTKKKKPDVQWQYVSEEVETEKGETMYYCEYEGAIK